MLQPFPPSSMISNFSANFCMPFFLKWDLGPCLLVSELCHIWIFGEGMAVGSRLYWCFWLHSLGMLPYFAVSSLGLLRYFAVLDDWCFMSSWFSCSGVVSMTGCHVVTIVCICNMIVCNSWIRGCASLLSPVVNKGFWTLIQMLPLQSAQRSLPPVEMASGLLPHLILQLKSRYKMLELVRLLVNRLEQIWFAREVFLSLCKSFFRGFHY